MAELNGGVISEKTISPSDFGLRGGAIDEIRVDNAQQSLEMINQVLENRSGPARDAVVMNAGAGIYVSGLVASLADGVARAEQVIADGSALTVRDQFVAFTNNI